MRKYQAIFTTLAALLCSGASFAASDTKAFHGGICVVDGFPDNGFLAVYAAGAFCLSPLSPNNCRVTCPLVRDKVNDADNLVDAAIEVSNADQGGGPLSCRFITMDEDSNSGIQFDSEGQSTTQLGRRQLIFGSTLDANAGSEGSYVVECDLGQSDFIHQINVAETTDSGGTD